MSFGAIGTIMVFHFGQDGSGPAARTNLLGYCWPWRSVRSSAPWSRCPPSASGACTWPWPRWPSACSCHGSCSPRSRPGLPIVHWRFTIFPGGNLVVGRPKLGPSTSTHRPRSSCRHGRLRRARRRSHRDPPQRVRPQARRPWDSPAACATLGLSVVRLKLSVFMLSAAIAGLGGALMAAQLGSVSPDRFDVFLSFEPSHADRRRRHRLGQRRPDGRAAAGVAFLAIANTFDKIGVDHSSASGLTDFAAGHARPPGAHRREPGPQPERRRPRHRRTVLDPA